jgi:protein SCO1/2
MGMTANAETSTIPIHGTYLPKSIPIKNFSLTDNHGQAFTEKNLEGQWSFLFFGFTNCGYVCPVTLTELNHLYQNLKKKVPPQEIPQIVFVTVDPERDTISKMNAYINSFNSHFVGVQGSVEETQKFENQLHITSEKIYEESGSKEDYSVNHSAEILIFNPKGQLQAYLAYPHKAKKMEIDYDAIKKMYRNSSE